MENELNETVKKNEKGTDIHEDINTKNEEDVLLENKLELNVKSENEIEEIENKEESIKDENENIERAEEEKESVENINDEQKQNTIKKPKSRMKKIILGGGFILIVLGLIYFVLMEMAKTNEDIEAKIIGERHSVSWSNESEEIDTKDFEKFKKILNEYSQKFDKTIVVFNQFDGCGNCIDEIVENLNDKIKDLNKSKTGILLVTTIDEEYIKLAYEKENKQIDIISDSNLVISKSLDMYNEEYNQVEDAIIVIEKENLESYYDEYYYTSSEDIVEYIKSYIK